MFVRPITETSHTYVVPTLSLFSPEPIEKPENDVEISKLETIERPPSPLEEVIVQPPKSFDDFAHIIRERIKPNPKFSKLTVEQQECLRSIILSEVMSNWSDMCQFIDYPGLSTQQNNRLHALVFIRVVEICQHLFLKYTDQISKYNARKVFTKEANISRINSNLISEANRQLNIHRLRQQILSNLKSLNMTKPDTALINKSTVSSKEDFLRYFDTIVMHESELLEQFSSLEFNFRPTKKPKKPKPVSPTWKDLDRFCDNGKSGEGDRGTLESETSLLESIDKRKNDLEYLLSDLRAVEKPPYTDDDDLPAILQATAKKEARRVLKETFPKVRRTSTLSSVIPSDVGTPLQPATTTHVMPDATLVKTDNTRVSERTTLTDMIVKVHPCVYNELQGDVTEKDIAFLDRNLFQGKEIKEVYNEIYKTLTLDHSKLISNMEEACPKLPPSDTYYNSGFLKQKRRRMKDHRLNTTLKRALVPPWGSTTSKEVWKSTGFYHHTEYDANQEFPSTSTLNNSMLKLTIGAPEAATTATARSHSPSSIKNTKSYVNWLTWWKSMLGSDDYQKYVATRDCDYLALLYHLYDSDDEFDSDDERELLLEQELELERERREQKMTEMLKEKNKFEDGFWNANAVLMGGLGNNPDPDMREENDSEDGPLKLGNILLPALPAPPSLPATPLPPSHMSMSGRGTVTPMSGISKVSKPSHGRRGKQVEKSELKLLEERLMRAWSELELPEQDKIDLTIKYCKKSVEKLGKVVNLWEGVCKSILTRESVIADIEAFERHASDSRRLFSKEFNCFVEERQRSILHARLRKSDTRVKACLTGIEEKLGDVVRHQGRDYREKMSRDLTEMLYWLQQERRSEALQDGGMVMLDVPPTP